MVGYRSATCMATNNKLAVSAATDVPGKHIYPVDVSCSCIRTEIGKATFALVVVPSHKK